MALLARQTLQSPAGLAPAPAQEKTTATGGAAGMPLPAGQTLQSLAGLAPAPAQQTGRMTTASAAGMPLPAGQTLQSLAGLDGTAAAVAATAAPAGQQSGLHYYRGRALNPGNLAASRMLQQGSVETRFMVFGDEEEVHALLHGAVSEDEVSSWVRGGSAKCIVLERDDELLACARLSGATQETGGAATLDCLAGPNLYGALGTKFLKRVCAVCAGWGCTDLLVVVEPDCEAEDWLHGQGFVRASADELDAFPAGKIVLKAPTRRQTTPQESKK